MSHLSPTTLTTDEQALILRATAGHPRDHLIFSMALGTGLRLAEIVGLNVGDVFAPDRTPRVRVRLRQQIAKGGRAADVFLPDRLVAKLKRLEVEEGHGKKQWFYSFDLKPGVFGKDDEPTRRLSVALGERESLGAVR